MSQQLKAPFPYFGGKSSVADIVWDRLGRDVPNYVEPFFGSGAMLLSRGRVGNCETVNDVNGYVANFWRAVQSDPDAVAYHADNPVNENDLHARHAWLVGQKTDIVAQLEGDPWFFDARVAGWWCWGMCCWIGGEFCDGKTGPWIVECDKLVQGDTSRGITRRRINIGTGRGVNRHLFRFADKGAAIRGWMQDLGDRLRNVRVCCGDWSRVCGDAPTISLGQTAVFLDPPYLHQTDDGKTRAAKCYGEHDCGEIARHVADWAREHGENPLFRIAICGYEGEHELPGWECLAWKTQGGYGNQSRNGSENAARERIWFSPHCVSDELPLFAAGRCT